jgi:hypothetical protein
MPGRQRVEPLPAALRWVLIVPALAAAGFDYRENALIAKMLAIGPSVGGELVSSASAATQIKSIAGAATEVIAIGLALVVFVRWWLRRA